MNFWLLDAHKALPPGAEDANGRGAAGSGLCVRTLRQRPPLHRLHDQELHQPWLRRQCSQCQEENSQVGF